MSRRLLIDDSWDPAKLDNPDVARTSDEAMQKLGEGGWDTVYLDNDLGLGQKEGWEILDWIMRDLPDEKWPKTFVVFSANIQARPRMESKLRAMGYEKTGTDKWRHDVWAHPNDPRNTPPEPQDHPPEPSMRSAAQAISVPDLPKINAPVTHGYNSYGSVWAPLREIKKLEVEERGNEWFDDSGLDLDKTMAIWVTENPKDAVLYNLPSEFRNVVDNYYRAGTLPTKKPKEYHLGEEDYQSNRAAFLNAKNNVSKVSLAGAVPVIEDDESFGKAYLFVKPVRKAQGTPTAMRVAQEYLQKGLDKGPLQYLGENSWHHKYYFMDVRDDKFVHFTTSARAPQIVKSRKLLLDAPYPGMGVYGVFAVSLTFGQHIPGVTLSHIEKWAKEEGGTVVAVEFTTHTVPKKYGYPEEVGWGEQDVDLINPKIISVQEAIGKIEASPVKLSDDDHEELVVYDKGAIDTRGAWALKKPEQPTQESSRVVLAFLQGTIHYTLPYSLESYDYPIYKDPTPQDVEEILKEFRKSVRAGIDHAGSLYAWSGKVPHEAVARHLRTEWALTIEYSPEIKKAFIFTSLAKRSLIEENLGKIKKAFPDIRMVDTAEGESAITEQGGKYVLQSLSSDYAEEGPAHSWSSDKPVSLAQQFHREAVERVASLFRGEHLTTPWFDRYLEIYKDPSPSEISQLLADSEYGSVRFAVDPSHNLYAWTGDAMHEDVRRVLATPFYVKLEYVEKQNKLVVSQMDTMEFWESHGLPVVQKLKRALPEIDKIYDGSGMVVYDYAEPQGVPEFAKAIPEMSYRMANIVGAYLRQAAAPYYRIVGDNVHIKHGEVPDDVWERFSDAMKGFGFDWRGGEDAKRLLARWQTTDGETVLDGDHAKGFLSAVGKLDLYKPRKGVKADNVMRMAIEHFGTTEDPDAAGFIMPNGELLNFGAGFGGRQMDHREIATILPKGMVDPRKSGFETIKAFCSLGPIRLHVGTSTVAFDVHRRPSSDQLRRVEDILYRESKKPVSVQVGGHHDEFPPGDAESALEFIKKATSY